MKDIIPGKTISHYRIIDKLGEGGMGVVYKAHDTTLDRNVALKFLPHYLTTDPNEKERFYQEARAAAALMHQNVAVIHEISEYEGQVFISMEYVEGETIKKIIENESESLTIKKVLDVAIQVCDGLAAAHKRNIVHRDIKPDNIMLNSEEQAKIMDFGLAKLKGATRLTKEGSTVGTASYMSPEQARGEDVDNRSDIFSFGVVLYEMLTTHIPFPGEHPAALIYSLLNETPQPVARFNDKVSQEFERIVFKALEKGKDERYQHIDDMLADLRKERKNLEYVRTGYVKASALNQISKEKTPGVKIKKLRTIISVAVVVLLAAAWLFLQKRTPELNPDMTFRTINIPFTDFQYPGLSQDGNWIVFPAEDGNGKWDIYWMHNSGGEVRRVTYDSSDAPPQRNLGAEISPDGSQILYNRYNAKTNSYEELVVSSNGGASRKISDRDWGMWSPDGKQIGLLTEISGKRGVLSIKPDGSDEKVVFIDSLGQIGRNISFCWSPDGKSIAWIRTFPDQSAELITHNLETGVEKQLTHDGKNMDDVFWAKNNMIIFSSTKSGNSNLWYVPADGGEEIQITKGGGPDLGIRMSSDCKKLLYNQYQYLGNIWTANGSGSDLQQLTFENQNIASLSLSPDGKYVAFTMYDDQGIASGMQSSHLYVVNSDGTGRRQLTFGNNFDSHPSFSPDGKHLTYSSYPLGKNGTVTAQIKMIDFTNPGTPKALRTGFYAWWINNTEMIVYDRFTSWKLSITNNIAEKFFRDSTYVFPVANGKRILYVDQTKAHKGLWLKIVDSGKDLLISKLDRWFIAAPGEQLMLYRIDGKICKVYLSNGKKEVLSHQLPGVRGNFSVSFSSDGKKVVFINTQPRSRLVMIENPFK